MFPNFSNAFPSGRVELYTVLMVFSLTKALVKILVNNLVKNLANMCSLQIVLNINRKPTAPKKVTKALVKILVSNRAKSLANIFSDNLIGTLSENWPKSTLNSPNNVSLKLLSKPWKLQINRSVCVCVLRLYIYLLELDVEVTYARQQSGHTQEVLNQTVHLPEWLACYRNRPQKSTDSQATGGRKKATPEQTNLSYFLSVPKQKLELNRNTTKNTCKPIKPKKN